MLIRLAPHPLLLVTLALFVASCSSEGSGVFVEPGESCRSDEDCPSGRCVEGSCNLWEVEDPDDTDDPEETPSVSTSSRSSICGAGGVSRNDEITLYHCFAPFDAATSPLRSEDVLLFSGGFELVAD